MPQGRRWNRRTALINLLIAITFLCSSISSLAGARAEELTPTPAIEAAQDDTGNPESSPAPPDPTATPSPQISTPTPEATATVAPADTPAPEPSLTAPSATATDAPAATSTQTQPATATPAPSTQPTPRPTDQIVAAATARLTIHSVDINGVHIDMTCYDIYRDAGGGALGSRVKQGVCDWQGDGIIEVDLAPGSYVLVETQRPPAFGTALNKPFSITGDRSITVKHQLLTTMVITSIDLETGLPVPGACYDLVPLTTIIYPPQFLNCDWNDGTEDGVTTLGGIDRGTYRLIEWSPPRGYLTVAERDVTVSTLSSPRTLTISHKKGATVLIHKRTSANQPLPGACFTLYQNNNGTPGDQVGNFFCDNHDGEDDGEVEGVSFPTGTYVLREFNVPTGYLAVPDQLISLTAGQTLELTLVDPTGGVVEIHSVDDQDNPIGDVCPALFADAGNGTRGEHLLDLATCQYGDSWTDGITRIIGLPPGDYVLGRYVNPPLFGLGAHLPPADVPFTIGVGETKTLKLVHPVGGKLLVTTVDATQPDSKIHGACFRVYYDAGGGTRGAQAGYRCDGMDEPKDGVTPVEGLPAGSYVLAQEVTAEGFNFGADFPFTIALGETKSTTVSNAPWGKVRITKQTPAGAVLPGACFVAIISPETPYPGFWMPDGVCDNADGANDGLIQISLPNGNFTLQEKSAPAGYVRAPNTDIQIRDGGITDVTIVDPLPSTLVLRFADIWGDPVTGLCLDAYGTNQMLGSLEVKGGCDTGDGKKDGRLTLSGLTWGSWELFLGNLPPQYKMAGAPIQLAPGESKTVDITLTENPPKITVGPRIDGLSQTSFTVYWETDQKMVSALTYGPLGGTQVTVPETPGAPTRIHRITVTGLLANTVYTVRATPTSPNGDLTSAELTIRTLSTANNGRVIASIVESDGSPLPGACFAVYTDAGGGELGSHVRSSCDWSDADGNNGTITIAGLRAGAYVLLEFYAPRAFKLARPVRFSLTDGQTKRLTVTNTRGGVVLRVTSREYNGPTLTGACFSIYRNPGGGVIGDYVTDVCDGLDGLDGVTTFSGIGPGDYYLWQHATPDGYIADPIKKFTVLSGQTNRYITYYSRSYADPDNVVLKAVDSTTGALVPGACFWLYNATNGVLSEFVADVCDGDDGKTDGITYFTRVRSGYSYAVLEYSAPRGYVAGKLTYFTKPIGKLYSKRITQTRGGTAVKVTTLKGSTSTKLLGACYGVYRLVNTQYIAVSVACDDWDGAVDGVTVITGVPAGTYRVYQNYTPPGYKTPAYVTVTVGTTTKGVTVRTYPQ